MSGAVFPLVPRRRVIGLAFGGMRSSRRGLGSDVAGSRPYRPGDDVDRIDWAASARLSSARGSDEFVVREHFADESPRVALLSDARPSMSLGPPPRSRLDKRLALEHARAVIEASTLAARSFVGYLDYGGGEPLWRPPRSHQDAPAPERGFDAPADTLARGLALLGQQRGDLPAGSFLFVLSDFLVTPPRDAWRAALARRWDIVPVLIQDPLWERSFPDVTGIVVSFAEASGGGPILRVRLSAATVARRREANEARFAEIMESFRSLGLDPVVLCSSDRAEIAAAFLRWADERIYVRGRA